MAEFNRDIDQQEEMASDLSDKAEALSKCAAELRQLLETMKGSAVLDDTSTGAVDTILKVVQKIQPEVTNTKNLATKVQDQASGARQAQHILAQIS